MPLIKRYPNRKLYNTETNKYINLEGIAEIIRKGEIVQVLDHVSGEDLTSVTLTQVIMEREKKDGGFLPHDILTTLIQMGGESLNTIRKKLASSEFIHNVDSEIEYRLQGLIRRGEIAEETGKKLRDQLIDGRYLWGGFSGISDLELEEALRRNNIPNRDKFQKLVDQIDSLSAKLDGLQD